MEPGNDPSLSLAWAHGLVWIRDGQAVLWQVGCWSGDTKQDEGNIPFPGMQ